jgi:hypothetical protein
MIALGEKKLRDIILPGSLNCGTYSSFNRAHKAQRLNVYRQLEIGVRYLDIRVGSPSKHDSEGKIRVMADEFDTDSNMHFDNLLREVRYFIDTHPGEFVIIAITPAGQLSTDQKYLVRDMVEQVFTKQKILIKEDLTWFNMETSTIRDIVSHNKNYLVFFDLAIIKDDLMSGKMNYLDIQNFVDDFPTFTR